MMYKWSVQDKVSTSDLEDVLNDFDGSGFDIYQIVQDINGKHTVIGRLPEMPLLVEELLKEEG